MGWSVNPFLIPNHTQKEATPLGSELARRALQRCAQLACTSIRLTRKGSHCCRPTGRLCPESGMRPNRAPKCGSPVYCINTQASAILWVHAAARHTTSAFGEKVTMSLEATRAQLAQLLDNDDIKVVALSGKWGTGKSHMWERLQTDSKNDKVTSALYASLFGLTSIDQLKMKLIQSAAPALEKNAALFDSAKKVLGTTVKVLEGFNKGFGALNDVGLLLAPAVLREKLIVLDDIERKHDKLNIEEVLGFIDEFTQRLGVRFLLVLNSDRLTKRDVWDALREKVVEEELRLETSCDEALAIAIELSPSRWSSAIAVATRTCSLTNIRIIRKVIKAVNTVIGDRDHISPAVMLRIVPSTVLLAAIHYKGIEDGPDFSYVLEFGSRKNWMDEFKDPTSKKPSPEDAHPVRWRTLMTNLGINSSDEFELLVAEFLQSGLYDVSKVSAIIDRYEAEHDVTAMAQAVHTFFRRSFWEHRLTDAQCIEEARPLVAKADLMDAMTATALHDLLIEFPGGLPLAEELIKGWVTAFRPKIVATGPIQDFFHRKVHPDIEALFKESAQQVVADTSVVEACKRMFEMSGWGDAGTDDAAAGDGREFRERRSHVRNF